MYMYYIILTLKTDFVNGCIITILFYWWTLFKCFRKVEREESFPGTALLSQIWLLCLDYVLMFVIVHV